MDMKPRKLSDSLEKIKGVGKEIYTVGQGYLSYLSFNIFRLHLILCIE